MSWMMETRDKALTIVKTLMSPIRVTDEYKTNAATTFPTIYFEFLESPEIDNDLENDEVAAIQFTAQLNVYTTNRTECKKITDRLLEVVKHNLRMTLTMTPIFYEDGAVTNGVFRARRVMGSGDTFIV